MLYLSNTYMFIRVISKWVIIFNWLIIIFQGIKMEDLNNFSVKTQEIQPVKSGLPVFSFLIQQKLEQIKERQIGMLVSDAVTI